MFKNLTPHNIVVRNDDGTDTVVEPAGMIARVSVVSELLTVLGGVKIYTTKYGEVVNLPAPEDGVYYIVSGMVKAAAPFRTDLVSPLTDGSAIRDEKGQIVAVRGLVI